jgi:hypothetical protein
MDYYNDNIPLGFYHLFDQLGFYHPENLCLIKLIMHCNIREVVKKLLAFKLFFRSPFTVYIFLNINISWKLFQIEKGRYIRDKHRHLSYHLERQNKHFQQFLSKSNS